MDSSKEMVSQQDLLSIIEDFIVKSSGLALNKIGDNDVSIFQKSDSKKIKVKRLELVDVLARKDSDGKEFVQVNFSTGRKILLTDQLIGFKPLPVPELDISKLPKVVTTLDLLSVFEAIEEASGLTGGRQEDTDTLKKVFQSILLGGEDVGFELSTERSWLKRLPSVTAKASA